MSVRSWPAFASLAVALVTTACGDAGAPAGPEPTDAAASGRLRRLGGELRIVGQPEGEVAIDDTVRLAAAVGHAVAGHGGSAWRRWTTSDSAVAVVTPDGLVRAVGAGTAEIAVEAAAPGRVLRATAAVAVGDRVAVHAGESIQAKVDARPPGTTFLVKAGVHAGQTVIPKSGTSFVGEPGAVLDGGGTAPYAFHLGGWDMEAYPSDVHIRGLVIQHYAPPPQMGAVRAGGHEVDDNAVGWTVEDCEIRYNATGGIRLGHRMRVLRNRVHHNGQIGVTGIGDSVLVEGNEIAHNNPGRAHDPGFEAGGTKFVQTRGLVVRGNFVHHNTGPGLWTDVHNVGALYEGNRVEDNAGMGIFHEVSYRAVIRDNVVLRNGFGSAGWVYGAGIMIASSGDVEVYGNTVADNHNGITAAQQDRGSGPLGPHVVENVYVHDNVIRMAGGRTGVAQDVGDASVFTARNIRFENNRYQLGDAERYFEWADGQRTEGEWRAYGHDATGTFERAGPAAARAAPARAPGRPTAPPPAPPPAPPRGRR
jgi:nitrous oxidase accessory protein NosD